ncbi:SDR family oxidoreductase [Candidatus Pelagibacter sp.]|nr:SDR family oxidoreductase [Candidatus Pelagibacter sp.]
MLLKNKVAVVTGCNRGIGKKIVEVFSENGANIYACVRKFDKDFNKYIKDLSKKYQNTITPVEIDFSSNESVEEGAKNILDKKISIDILINNAGIIENSLFQMTRIENLKKIFDINYFSITQFTQLILKGILKNKKGSIVYISSTSALDNNLGRNAYSSTKAAVISQAHTLSRELGRSNIRVNSIAPGLTDTDMMRDNTPDNVLKDVVSRISLKRIGDPSEIANVALFLSSDLSTYLTGQTIRVDGGM